MLHARESFMGHVYAEERDLAGYWRVMDIAGEGREKQGVTAGNDGARDFDRKRCRALSLLPLGESVEGVEDPMGWVRGNTDSGELSVMASGPIARFQGLPPFFDSISRTDPFL